MIQLAIEAELSSLLERFANIKTLHGKRAAVRNGHLPEREVLTAAGRRPSYSCHRRANKSVNRRSNGSPTAAEPYWTAVWSAGPRGPCIASSRLARWSSADEVAAQLGRSLAAHDRRFAGLTTDEAVRLGARLDHDVGCAGNGRSPRRIRTWGGATCRGDTIIDCCRRLDCLAQGAPAGSVAPA